MLKMVRTRVGGPSPPRASIVKLEPAPSVLACSTDRPGR
jgi:hypothetical protein